MHKGMTVVVALAAAALATPVAIGTTTAFATPDRPATAAPVAAAPAEAGPATVAPLRAEAGGCKKVRVVYGGYGDAPVACVATAAR